MKSSSFDSLERSIDSLERSIESLERRIDSLGTNLCAELVSMYHKTIVITAGIQLAHTAILIGAMSYFMGGS